MHTSDLDELIEEATVDAYDEREQRVGFYTMLEDNLSFPFSAEIIGETVSVCGLDAKDEQRILAIVRRNGQEYRVDLLDLKVEDTKAGVAEWIAAYHKWCGYV